MYFSKFLCYVPWSVGVSELHSCGTLEWIVRQIAVNYLKSLDYRVSATSLSLLIISYIANQSFDAFVFVIDLFFWNGGNEQVFF